MSPRVVDRSLALAVGIAFATGLLSLARRRPEQWPVVAMAGAAGFCMLLPLPLKPRRFVPRLLRPAGRGDVGL